MKRVLTLILTAMLLVSAYTSCSGGNKPAVEATSISDNSAVAEETTTTDEPELPQTDYDGAEFKFLIRSRNAASYQEKYIIAEEMDGEVVNDAVYTRNSGTEEKFNIKIAVTEDDNPHEIAKKAIAANEDIAHVASIQRNALGSLSISGYMANFKNIPYIQLDAPYWDGNAAQQLDIDGKLFMMPSDISMANLQSGRFLYFNKKLINDYSLDSPYDLVNKNEWILENFLSLVRGVSKDLDGNGTMDRNDQFGMLSEEGAGNGNVMHLLAGADVSYVTRDSDGRIQLSIMNERTDNVILMCRETLYQTPYAIEYNAVAKGADYSMFSHLYAYGRSLFGEDHFLFVQNGVGETVQWKDMESDYGIVPNPKYDSEQSSYWHRTDQYSLLFAIPLTNSDTEMTGMVLEYMAWLSSKTLLPAFYDVTIKSKRVRDDMASEMLDLIKESFKYEICDIYGIAVSDMLNNAFKSGNLASEYAKKESALQTSIDKLYDQFAALQ